MERVNHSSRALPHLDARASRPASPSLLLASLNRSAFPSPFLRYRAIRTVSFKSAVGGSQVVAVPARVAAKRGVQTVTSAKLLAALPEGVTVEKMGKVRRRRVVVERAFPGFRGPAAEKVGKATRARRRVDNKWAREKLVVTDGGTRRCPVCAGFCPNSARASKSLPVADAAFPLLSLSLSRRFLHTHRTSLTPPTTPRARTPTTAGSRGL